MSRLAMELVPSALRRDPSVYGPRIRVRVDVMPLRTSIPGLDKAAKQGVSEHIILASDLPLLTGKLETDWASVAQAGEVHEQRKRAWIEETTRAKLPDERKEWADDQVRAEAQYGLTSPQSVFREITGRDMKALRSVDVVCDVSPEQDERLQMARDVARELAGLTHPSPIRGAMETSSAGELDELRALVRKQSQDIAALQAGMAPRKRGRPRKVPAVTE